ncbi:hypothetical protein FRC01_008094 [Tulasnella sp. 417]|nr:hypothetical protein FRC01_008094 [Tulasnella sp. 417]
MPEEIEEIEGGSYWHDDPRERGAKPSTVTEPMRQKGSLPGRIGPPPKLRLTFHPQHSRSTDRVPPKKPRKRKRRFDEVSDSDAKPVDDDVSSSSEWSEDSGAAANPEGDVPLDPSLSVSRNGKYFHSIWTSRGTQRNLRIFTGEEEARIAAECTPRWCHMCHKKKLIMSCNGTKGRCRANFCDHCLARYPLDFDPFTTFSCPKCEGTCICGGCMQNRANREAKRAARDSKPRRKAAPRTKLSKAQRAEQTKLLEAVKNLPSEAELSDASNEDVAVPVTGSQTGEPNRGTASTLSSPSPPSPPPQLPDQTTSTATIRWSTPSSLLAASPGIQSAGVEQESPPLPSFYSPAYVEDYSYLRSKSSISPPRSSSPSSVSAASYFEKQVRLVEAKESVQKLKDERRKAIPTVSPFEMTSEQVFEWAEPFRKQDPVPQPLHLVKRRYKFPELNPGFILPGQTWVGDVGMFGFDEEEIPASKVPQHSSDQQQGAKDVGVSLGQLELKLSGSPNVKPELADLISNTDPLRNTLACDCDDKMPVDSPVSDTHSRAASGSSEATNEMTPACSTSTIVADEGEEGFAYYAEKTDQNIKFLNETRGISGSLDTAGLSPRRVDGHARSRAGSPVKAPGSFILV